MNSFAGALETKIQLKTLSTFRYEARPHIAEEALISEAACLASGLDLDHLDRRQVELKGRTEPLAVRVMRVG